jgi:hypothetical protein
LSLFFINLLILYFIILIFIIIKKIIYLLSNIDIKYILIIIDKYQMKSKYYIKTFETFIEKAINILIDNPCYTRSVVKYTH